MDVDGVLTDAGMYYSESGDELKKFNTRDGHGITLLHAAEVLTAIVARERTTIVTRRAQKLKNPGMPPGSSTSFPCGLQRRSRRAPTPVPHQPR